MLPEAAGGSLIGLQVGLFTQLCHWIGVRAVYKPFVLEEILTSERASINRQILDKKRFIKGHIYFELLYFSCI